MFHKIAIQIKWKCLFFQFMHNSGIDKLVTSERMTKIALEAIGKFIFYYRYFFSRHHESFKTFPCTHLFSIVVSIDCYLCAND